MPTKKTTAKTPRGRAKGSTQSWEIEWMGIERLHYDARNPRLAELREDISEGDVLQVLWREMAVDEIALSIAENGFFPHEPLFVANEGSKLVVVEGNRRLAAVRLLCDSTLRAEVGATDLPRISSAARTKLQRLPVIVSRRQDLWQFIGFKHVNGPQSWGSFAKARYVTWVHNALGVPLEEIAKQIGDRHDTVKRLNHGYLVLEQAEKEGVFSRDDRWKSHFSFSHLYTGLSYPGIQKFLGTEPKSGKRNPVPKKNVKNLGMLCEWLYGSRSKSKKPLVQSQNPDLRILEEVVQSKDGRDALAGGLPLTTSQDISRGDERIFREALQLAKKSLQDARGTMLTGYAGERDKLETAADILELASDLHESMSVHARSRSARRRKPATRRRA